MIFLMETITFSEWLTSELQTRKMSQTELAKKSGVTPAQISRILSGQRGAESKTLYAIATALKIPPEEVFQMAGKWNEKTPPEDSLLNRINTLYRTLKDPGNKTRALEYLEFLTQLEEKNARRRKKP
jgi:transcriptional regulator with XRE-family HTH domain